MAKVQAVMQSLQLLKLFSTFYHCMDMLW